MSRVLSIEREYQRRAFAEANRRTVSMRPLGSITWGTRARGLGSSLIDTGPLIVSPPFDPASIRVVSMGPIPQEPRPIIAPFPGNPDTQPGAWPGLITSPGPITYPGNEPPPIVASGAPGQVPVVVTPTSGPIPSPGTVAAGTSAPPSWLDQSLIGGIPNKFLLLGGIGAFLLFGGKRK